MTTKNLYHRTWKLRATIALVLAVALSTFPAAFSRAVKAQTPAKSTSQTPPKTTTSPAGESKGGQKEGIKVHGHWTIDVRNPDGKLVTHREFENALTSDGGLVLSLILGRVAKPGLWQIALSSTGYSSPWSNSPGALIVEPDDGTPLALNVSKNLSLCVGGSTCILTGSPPMGTFTLSGNISADQNGAISLVNTDLFSCPPEGPCNFPFPVFHGFTFHPLAPLVNESCPQNTQCVVKVVARQIIVVTVAFTFS